MFKKHNVIDSIRIGLFIGFGLLGAALTVYGLSAYDADLVTAGASVLIAAALWDGNVALQQQKTKDK